jgi:hypothetical protein
MKDIVTKYKWRPRANWDPVLRSNWNRDYRRASIDLRAHHISVTICYKYDLNKWVIVGGVFKAIVMEPELCSPKDVDYNTLVLEADKALATLHQEAQTRLDNNSPGLTDRVFVAALKEAMV